MEVEEILVLMMMVVMMMLMMLVLLMLVLLIMDSFPLLQLLLQLLRQDHPWRRQGLVRLREAKLLLLLLLLLWLAMGVELRGREMMM